MFVTTCGKRETHDTTHRFDAITVVRLKNNKDNVAKSIFVSRMSQ